MLLSASQAWLDLMWVWMWGGFAQTCLEGRGRTMNGLKRGGWRKTRDRNQLYVSNSEWVAERIRLWPAVLPAGCAGKRSPCSRPSRPPPVVPGCGKSPAFLWESCAGSWCEKRGRQLSKGWSPAAHHTATPAGERDVRRHAHTAKTQTHRRRHTHTRAGAL